MQNHPPPRRAENLAQRRRAGGSNQPGEIRRRQGPCGILPQLGIPKKPRENVNGDRRLQDRKEVFFHVRRAAMSYHTACGAASERFACTDSLAHPACDGQKFSMRQILTAFAAVFFLVSLHAELPPSVYEQMQAAAPEYLEVEILRVDIEPGAEPGQQDVEITARIAKVNRSSANLQPGGMLNILYTLAARPPGFVGPGQVTIPAEGDKTVAYLKNGEKPEEFEPAAGAMTFRNF